MSNILERDKNFKEAIGEFIIAFSKLEYGFVSLCSMTEFDIRKKDHYILKYLGFTFEQKTRHLTEFIEEHLSEIKPIWDLLKVEIGQLNRDRRFIAHGFINYSLSNESITTYIKERGEVKTKIQTVQEIKAVTNKLYHLSTGENGINGEFHTLFTKTRINKWNNLVSEDNKVIYKVNDEIISDWKGKNANA